TYRNIETIVEAVDGGYDTMVTDSGGTMPDNVERLVANGSGTYFLGNDLDNVIEVESSWGATLIDGGEGADHMVYGGPQSVTFRIDNPGDTFETLSNPLTTTVESTLAGSFV